MLREYRLRWGARQAVAERLDAIKNTCMKPPSSSTLIIELSKPEAAVDAVDLAQSVIAQRSVETQTASKSVPATVSFKVVSNDNGVATSNTAIRNTATATDAKSTNFTAVDIVDGPRGRYINWSGEHTVLAAAAWCCIGDLMTFCDRYEFKVLAVHDAKTQQTILAAVRSFLHGLGQAPFHMRRRFPTDIRNAENLWLCVERCPAVEYHLKRIISIFRRPLSSLPLDKQRAAIQNFHLAVNELRLDISARISEVRLYDRLIFEREFKLTWLDEPQLGAEKSSALDLRKAKG